MSSYIRRKTPGNTEWFAHDRFGMFIHFGLYAMPARHEWIRSREEIPDEKYNIYFKHFNPDLFDAREWAKSAKKAGMKYAVLTAKHHEGFCLFDSAYTDFKITNTPFGRDLVKEFTEAFRAEGLRVGLYYSLIDWQHPDFTIDHHHPHRNHPEATEMNKTRDMKRYAEYMRNQVTELLTNYGDISCLWLDFSYNPCPTYPQFEGKWKADWESEKLIALARRLQPGIIINNRSGLEQDLWTPEQYQPTGWLKHGETDEFVTWEACQTLSGAWGYFRDEMTWKSPEILIEMLIKTVSCGGNLIMNVGPTSRGCLDRRAEDALDVYGEWMRCNSRSIYGCTMAEPEFTAPEGCCLTQSEDGSRLYIHLLSYPFRRFIMPDLVGKVEYAQFLHDGSEVLFHEILETAAPPEAVWESTRSADNIGAVAFDLPVIKPDITVPVIELFLK